MSAHEASPVARRLKLRSGEVACEVTGSETGRLVIGIPGLTANLRSFDVIYEALDGARYRKVAFDPRGRGRSEATAPGTYGWPAHARDVIEIADQLGSETFEVLGWSMGAWIAMVVAQMAPERVRKVVLIDAAGEPEESAKVPVYAGLDRLSTVFPSREAFLGIVSQMPHYQPWPRWQRLFEYELVDVDLSHAEASAVGGRAVQADAEPIHALAGADDAGVARTGGAGDPTELRLHPDEGRLRPLPP